MFVSNIACPPVPSWDLVSGTQMCFWMLPSTFCIWLYWGFAACVLWFVLLLFPCEVVGNFMFIFGGCWFEKYFDCLLLYFGEPWPAWLSIKYPLERLLSCILVAANFCWFWWILFSFEPIWPYAWLLPIYPPKMCPPCVAARWGLCWLPVIAGPLGLVPGPCLEISATICIWLGFCMTNLRALPL